MEQERKNQKKVSYKLISDKKCKECNKPLKINQVNKGFKICYVCFQISKGKKVMNNNKKDDFGNITTKGTINLLQLQAQNRVKYRR